MVTFTAQANRTYTVQAQQLLATGAWVRVADVPAAATNRLVDLAETNMISRERYYRLVTPLAR